MPRRRLLIVSLTAALAVLIAGGAYAVARARPAGPVAGPPPSPAGPSSPAGASSTPSPPPGADITGGPLNLLIVGLDTRVDEPGWRPHSDALLILHVTRDLRAAYLTSLPRDLVVDVPAFPPAGFPGGKHKITDAMAYGSVVPGGRPDPAQGVRLLATTVGGYTGIRDFDATAVISMEGYDELIDALGGVRIRVDVQTPSIHRKPDGTRRAGDGDPQQIYRVGTMTMTGWQAIDYARQRYLAGGDYTRQRHHRQLLKAMLTAATDQGLLRDAARMESVLAAVGDMLVLDGGAHTAVDLAFALSHLRPADLTLVGLPGDAVREVGEYRGEALRPPSADYFKCLRAGTLPDFTRDHPELVDRG
ncbi:MULTISPECIES: LCP family protein [Catenuloplanes]|uniref:Anionic cell wall polymer biosynthesis LytR-Cps2A-Psr (LCP) family protein n=1 Tax=Catenuloplanes niger TaxID=587534 RepID=A0AAE3ZMS4_9ACTN|nr:LCP family protein [Catenuloplanes niger]MDR7322803.1 anionic cell wall polymer biosynthesis LytR-Cps2A-Psr (LCP) family protein [Catenuloplanes niger]